MIKTYKLTYESPIGVIEIIGTDKAILSILFSDEKKKEMILDETPPVLAECYNQLDEYFKGERLTFNFPIQCKGTEFQKSVWKALESISYGKTGSYRDIANTIGNEKAIRAVGNANSKNMLSIVIPCHRIIGSNGTLTGYAGGIWRKKWLLEHERSRIDTEKVMI
ncbi:methylated-DNA--[protein]-cysteine S-methyltransferase [Bacillus mesophilum]|uniref:Methylated-DNA--protein-cysteine methyltransferase n=1 Tax=Bacillus mesophilum TaxID=1071718 RepID=A0A7V7RIV5_9BACI|nr:methylated-DNA--[protein]-cysteine S-methyltransferase [Bacillus mesophilum]KAB2330341.1 methylated-DNA--[protein]-cysteine S-methyltransferase [Bacillus mesophilum]